ncbi:hypothetical protein POM88_028908 [Heracleum sosnowskyi]|uniref:Uncharacterized protein n=1 Tax=Heracleum sosnowskyi TaxID=360622 RepID=A0AAD8HV77_9APIA|nr:hypothetical protein POM88_028908 [Heracleum sosnowskyi]
MLQIVNCNSSIEHDELAKEWTEKVKQTLHVHDAHELVFVLGYICGKCDEEGHIWAFNCEESKNVLWKTKTDNKDGADCGASQLYYNPHKSEDLKSLRIDAPKYDGKTDVTMWQLTMKYVLIQRGLDDALEKAKAKEVSDADWAKIQKRAVSTIRLELAPDVIYNMLKESTPK